MNAILKTFLVLLSIILLSEKSFSQSLVNYEIFSKVIDKRYKHIPYQYILIADSTEMPINFIEQIKIFNAGRVLASKKTKSTQKSWEIFLKNFNYNKEKNINLNRKIVTDTKLRFVSNHYQLDVSWPIKNGKTPKVYDRAGINILTPIFYSEDKQKALCAINLVFPGEGESLILFLLEKQKSEWCIVWDDTLTVTAR